MTTNELAEYIESVFKAGVMFGKGLITKNDFENLEKQIYPYVSQKYNVNPLSVLALFAIVMLDGFSI